MTILTQTPDKVLGIHKKCIIEMRGRIFMIFIDVYLASLEQLTYTNIVLGQLT